MSLLLTILEIAFIYVFLKKYGLIATVKMLVFAIVILFDFLLHSEE